MTSNEVGATSRFHPGHFFETLIDGALKRVPKAERLQVRRLREAGK